MNKNTSLSPLQIELREAMSEWGCPLCRLAARAEQAYIDSLNYERVLDLNTRDALKASRGLCATHSRQWQELQGSALAIAIVYRVSVLDLLRDSDIPAPKRNFLQRDKEASKMAQTLAPQGTCLACDLGEDTAQRYGDVLLKDIADPASRTLLRECGGLCVPHLRKVLVRPGAGKAYPWLLEIHREAWKTLLAEMEEFIRKNDYRFRQETVNETEADSWIRALDILVGRR